MLSTITAVLYFLKDISAVCALLFVYHFFFLYELEFKKIKVALMLCTTGFNAFLGVFFMLPQMEDGRSLMDFISYAIYIVCLQMFSDNKKITKSIWTVTFFIFTTDMFYALASHYLGDEMLSECIFNIVILSGICAAIYYGVKKMQLNFLPEVFAEIPKWIYGAIILFDLTCYYKEIGEFYVWYNLLYLISSVSVVLCALYLVFKIYYMANQQNDILRQLELQRDFGEKAILGDEEVRRFRHDYKNHMIVVNAYLESGRMTEAREYINSISQNINSVINRIKTGNFVADAILNSKLTLALKADTDILFSGYIPPNGVNSEDISTILSNLIDNAIEACEKAKESKEIIVEAKCVNQSLILSVSNPTVVKSSTKFRTIKKDKLNHGIGIRNIERAVKKYDGTMVISNEDNMFTVDVKLTLRENVMEKIQVEG